MLNIPSIQNTSQKRKSNRERYELLFAMRIDIEELIKDKNENKSVSLCNFERVKQLAKVIYREQFKQALSQIEIFDSERTGSLSIYYYIHTWNAFI